MPEGDFPLPNLVRGEKSCSHPFTTQGEDCSFPAGLETRNIPPLKSKLKFACAVAT